MDFTIHASGRSKADADVGRVKMIATVLMGGLGNQMFQYAAGRGLALQRGVELVISTSALSLKRRNETLRKYELDNFRVFAKRCHAAQERELVLACRLGRFSRLLTPWNVQAERAAKFDPLLLESPDGTVLRGYWQTERYFEHCRQSVARELTPVEPLPPAHEAWRQRMLSGPSVSVHVRRGDYVTMASAASFQGALPMTYYQAAIARIQQIESAPVCYVFSDDPAWCKLNLAFSECEMHHVSAELASSGTQDLVLMRSCSHHIIANSSFSWWAAWLSGIDKGNGGAVIAPRQWFAGAAGRVGAANRFPSHWELL